METAVAIKDMQALFDKEKLPCPTLPPMLQQALQHGGPQNWSTGSELGPPDDLARRIKYVQKGGADMAEVGFYGHGINSWLMYCHLVHGPLALFIQCRWGNAYDDPARCRTRIEGVMDLARILMLSMEEACKDGFVQSGDRLIVCFSDHLPSRWQWTSEMDRWHEDGDFSLLMALQSLKERTGRDGWRG